MCGIFGFSTSRDLDSSVVVEGLKDLEYRGYDSWGVAIARDGTVMTQKQVGKIGQAKAELPSSTAALGHTRWATHGAVTKTNAHPHVDCEGRLAVIHNGIIENHAAIRRELQDHNFRSETDTEVVAHLLEDAMARPADAKPGNGLVKGLMQAFSRLEGLSAIAALDGRTGEIAAVKNGSPLAIGLTDSGPFLASDPVALLPHTRRLIFVEDGQAVSVRPTGVHLFDVRTGGEVQPQIRTVDWVRHDRGLDRFEHYMEKEINEQPRVLRHLAANKQTEVDILVDMIQSCERVFVIGCGTANHAGVAAQYLFSSVAARQLTSVLASEMRLVAPLLGPSDLVVALSQSGETIDVLDGARLAQGKGAQVIALTNSEGSSLHRLADAAILLDCGPERCVLATKTFTAKLGVLAMAAHALAGQARTGREAISRGAFLLESQLIQEEESGRLDKLAQRLSSSDHIFVLGRHTNYPMALEAALKIKEVSYIHAEGFATGELKHGVIALVQEGTPCLIFATDPQVLSETLAGASEVHARGAFTIGFSRERHPEFDLHVPIHGEGESAMFELCAVFQMLAYRLALLLGRDPDKPRNLAKSVTVR